MILNTRILDWLTCIKKFEVPLQVANRTKKEISKKSSNLNLKPFILGFYCSNQCRNIVGYCRNIVATAVHQWCYTVLRRRAETTERMRWRWVIHFAGREISP
jgi:hypothetical protein